MKQSLKIGVLQAIGVSAYITLVGLFMWNANNIFGKGDNFATPIFVLMLLSASIMVCGIIVLYKPYKLFISGKTKEALETVIYTAISLFIILLLLLGAILLFK